MAFSLVVKLKVNVNDICTESNNRLTLRLRVAVKVIKKVELK